MSNRDNAQKSTGPRTEEGKAVSSRNSFKHGITGRKVCVAEGQIGIYNEFVNGIIDSLRPDSPLELQLCRDIADSHWRLGRIKEVEDAMLAQAAKSDDHPDAELLAQGALFLERPTSFGTITLYEQRIRRGIKTSMEELRQLQAEHQARIRRDMPRAVEHYKEQLMRDLPFDPADDGFVFSIEEIRQSMWFNHREQRSSHAKTCNYNRAEYEKLYPLQAA